MRATVTALGTIVLVACGEATWPPPDTRIEDTPPATITMQVGETLGVNGVRVTFSGVPHDSRCPVDVQCVWAGNAVVELIVSPEAGLGPAHRLTLNTSDGPREGEALGLRFLLLELRPAALSTRDIPAEDYVVALRIAGIAAPASAS